MTRPDQHNYAFYSRWFYKGLNQDIIVTSSRNIIKIVQEYIHFDSVIDIGCGIGQILRACSEAGAKTIRGVDGTWVNKNMLVIPPECFTPSDISQPNLAEKIPEKKLDLTVSSEVAEHINSEDCENYMNNLVSFSDVILFSAAIPGQGGTHHVNEQYPSYWIKKFEARGFVPVDCIRPKIWWDKSIFNYYRQNLLIFVKKESLKNYPKLEAEADRPILDAVHPDLWKPETIGEMSIRQLCMRLFTSIKYIIPVGVLYILRRLKAK